MTADCTILRNLVAVRLDVTIWSARKKLTPADLGSADLPPEKLASLGSKRICDPSELRIFGALKGRAVSLLDRTGVRFLGGWAIPDSAMRDMEKGLQEIATEFEKAKEEFLNRYDEAVREWIRDNPGWEALITRSQVSASYVRTRLGFSWQMFKVVAPKQKGKASQKSGLGDEVAELGSTLFGEIAKAARETWHKSYEGKTEITRKALSPLQTLHAKLSGLTFVEPRVAPVASLLETALKRIPRRGKIQGADLIMLQGLVFLMRDPKALLEHGQRIIEGRSTDKILDDILLPASANDTSNPGQANANVETMPDSSSPMQEPLDSMGLW